MRCYAVCRGKRRRAGISQQTARRPASGDRFAKLSIGEDSQTQRECALLDVDSYRRMRTKSSTGHDARRAAKLDIWLEPVPSQVQTVNSTA